MKTQIIYLDSKDSAISIIDKFSSSRAPRIVLVFPSDERTKLNQFSLKLIKRAAINRGISLAIVAKGKPEKLLANHNAIPQFSSVHKAQKDLWNFQFPLPSKRSKKKTIVELLELKKESRVQESGKFSNPWLRFTLFLAGVLSVVFGLIFFYPSADIQLQIPEKSASFELNVYTNAEGQNEIESGTLPIYIDNVIVEGKKILKVKSQSLIPVKFSSGVIEFTNLTENEVIVPKGTIIAKMNDPLARFEVVNGGFAPGGVGNRIQLPIRSLIPGKIGNQEKDSLVIIVGDLGLKLTATNPAVISGGSDLMVSYPSLEERDLLFSKLEEELRIDASNEANFIFGDRVLVIPESIKVNNILKEEYIPDINLPAEYLSLKLKISYEIKFWELSELENYCKTIIKNKIPSKNELIENSINIKLIDQSLFNNGKYKLLISYKLKREIDYSLLADLFKGESIKTTDQLLNNMIKCECNPIIDIRPDWWRRLPFLAFRINITN